MAELRLTGTELAFSLSHAAIARLSETLPTEWWVLEIFLRRRNDWVVPETSVDEQRLLKQLRRLEHSYPRLTGSLAVLLEHTTPELRGKMDAPFATGVLAAAQLRGHAQTEVLRVFRSASRGNLLATLRSLRLGVEAERVGRGEDMLHDMQQALDNGATIGEALDAEQHLSPAAGFE